MRLPDPLCHANHGDDPAGMIPVLAQALRRPEPILGLAARATWLSPASAAPGSRSTTPGRGRARNPVLRNPGLPRHLSQGVDGGRPSAREFRGCAACPRGSTTGSRTRTHGALPPGRRLEPGQRPRRGDAGKVRGTEGALPDRSDEGRRVPHRRRALDSDVAPRAAARASLYGVDLLRRHGPRARVLRPRGSTTGPRTRTHGSFTTWAKTGARPATSPRRCRESSRN